MTMSFSQSIPVLLLVMGVLLQAPSGSAKGRHHPSSTSAGKKACTEEQHRPRYHFSPAENWINDPNGMVWYDGVYHLFYQYHPYSTTWGPMHWGHAVSPDMVTWEELPIALYPDDLGAIFSGSAVVDSRNTTGFQTSPDTAPLVAIYTSADGPVQRQSIAYSLDKGETFQKYAGNPVLADPNRPDFRDPKVTWKKEGESGGRWTMSLAVGDRVEFFSSPDLITWTLNSDFGADPPQGSHGGVWECPDLVDISVGNETVWVLLVSINPGGPNQGSATQYFVGNFSLAEDGTAYTFSSYPWSSYQWLDWGPDDYAGVTFSNEPQGRHVYMGWMNNWAYANNLPTARWRGQMTLPRSMGLVALNPGNIENPQYRVTSNPVPELESLRNPDQYFEISETTTLPSLSWLYLTDRVNFSTPLMELEVTVEIPPSNQFRFAICAYNSLGEEHCFGYNSNGWYLDRSNSGNVDFHSDYQQSAFAPRLVSTEQTVIRLFLDVSSLEVFADDGLSTMTALHYPTQPFDKIFINNRATSGDLKVLGIKLWGLRCWYQG